MADMIDLVRKVVGDSGRFRFLVTDHGAQFGRAFKQTVKALGGTVVKGKVKTRGSTERPRRFSKY
jgi:hypothetical protein